MTTWADLNVPELVERGRKKIMARFYFDDDADLSILAGQSIGIIGYGNQGRSQALNLRDSGLRVHIGNVEDQYAQRAREDGFIPRPIAEISAECDLLLLLIPDEVQPTVYTEHMHKHLRQGQLLGFAHGYNIYFGFIEPPDFVDVVMIAPRMLGIGVREAYTRGIGFPSLVAIHQDYSGRALARTLALAKGIGSTRMGVLMSSFEEETLIDLLGEHQPALYEMRAQYEVLVEAGCSPEAVILDMYASGESVVWEQAAMELGAFERMKLASHTAQFGHMVWSRRYFNEDEVRSRLREAIKNIKDGTFAEAWYAEQQAGLPRLKRVWQQNREHPMMEAEDKLYRLLGRRPTPRESAP